MIQWQCVRISSAHYVELCPSHYTQVSSFTWYSVIQIPLHYMVSALSFKQLGTCPIIEKDNSLVNTSLILYISFLISLSKAVFLWKCLVKGTPHEMLPGLCMQLGREFLSLLNCIMFHFCLLVRKRTLSVPVCSLVL